MPFCVHCTQETVKRCECCPNTHYCSKKCQQADWSAVHRYERYFYRLDASDIAEGNVAKDSATAGQRPRTKEEQLVDKVVRQEINDDRLEFNRLLEGARATTRTRKPTKRFMKMTHKERAAHYEHLDSLFVDPTVTRAERRRKFVDELTQLIEKAGDPPVSLEKPQLGTRKIVFDERAQAELAVLFRKQDILHAKDTYALITATIADAEDAAAYRIYVEDMEARFAHALFFGRGDQALISYEAVHAQQQEQSRQSLANGLAEMVLKQATDDAARLWAKAYQDTERDRRSKSGRQYGSPLSMGGKGDGDDGDDGDDDDTNNPTMEDINNIAEKMIPVAEAKLSYMQQIYNISEQTTENTRRLLRQTWDAITPKVSRLVNKVRGKHELLDNLIKTVEVDYGINANLGLRLGNFNIFAAFALALIYYYIALIFGYCWYENPHSPHVANATQKAERLEGIRERLFGFVEEQRGKSVVAKKMVEGLDQIVGQPNATAGYMSVDWANPGVLTVEKEIQVNASVTGLVNYLVSKNTTNPVWQGIKNSYLEGATAVRNSTTPVEWTQSLFNLKQATEENAELLGYTNTTVGVDTVREAISTFTNFTRDTGMTLDNMETALKEASVELGGLRGDLKTEYDNVIKKAIDAPFIRGLVERFALKFGIAGGIAAVGFMAYVSGYVYAPMLNAAVDTNGRAGIDQLIESERLVRSSILQSGILEPQASLYNNTWSWAGSMAYMMKPWDAFPFMYTLLTGAAMLAPTVRLGVYFFGDMVEGTGRTIARIMDGCLFGAVGDEKDIAAMQEIAKKLTTKYGGNVKAAKMAAYQRYLHSQEEVNTPLRYAILIELIMKNKQINRGHLWMHRLALVQESVSAAFDILSFAYYFANAVQAVVKLFVIFFWLLVLAVSGPSGFAMVVAGYCVVALAISFWDFWMRPVSEEESEFPLYFRIADVAWRRPMAAFMNFISKPTPLHIFAVTAVYWMFSCVGLFGNITDIPGPLKWMWKWVQHTDPTDTVEHIIPRVAEERAAVAQLKEFLQRKDLGAINEYLRTQYNMDEVDQRIFEFIALLQGTAKHSDIKKMIEGYMMASKG